MAAQDNQSYLSKLSPWGRTTAAQPGKVRDSEQPEPLQKQQKGVDHIVTHRHRLSLRHYPRDCPRLKPQWFHAIDVPKRRPRQSSEFTKEEKAPGPPKKYAPFSVKDSKAIEVAYRKLAEEEDGTERETLLATGSSLQAEPQTSAGGQQEIHVEDDLRTGKIKVPVNEDYLFDVDVERRELAPAYWLGPVYDVRRGTWFYQDGSVQRPCDENLAIQLEEGYLKVKAWKLPSQQPATKPRSASQPRAPRPTSWTPGQEVHIQNSVGANSVTPQASGPDLRKQALQEAIQNSDGKDTQLSAADQVHNTYQLFGAHMGSVVTYQDATTAWLLTDDFMSRMNFSMYSRFAGGGHFGGTKVTRGYLRVNEKPESKDGKAAEGKNADKADEAKHADRLRVGEDAEEHHERPQSQETRRQTLERQMSSLLEDPASEDHLKHEEEMRRRDEREIEEDYREVEGDEQDREIDHLILVTHGIGQRLSLRIESVNFVHDVNTLRKTIKAVYADSPDLRALNEELDSAEHMNSRVQVLPICWRHLLDFPKQSLKQNRKEHDLGDTEVDDDAYPSLEDISVEGVPAVRNLITDLALDILLYQSPAYKEHISRVVVEECNKIYHLFMERNPDFKGKVSFIGHSLGSAIMFDLLCRQSEGSDPPSRRKDSKRLKLDFEVEDFYALGSPIGLFQMLKGRKVAAREATGNRRRGASTSVDDPMLDIAVSAVKKLPGVTGNIPDDLPASSPKCNQIYNIFHPTDPISYRMEPLISPTMAKLKPQPLPYTKRGIFGAPMGQGLTGIGARVSQSMSSMWSSMASSLLTRGLGYTGNEPNAISGDKGVAKSSAPLSIGPDTNIAADVIPNPNDAAEIPKPSENSQDQVAKSISTGQRKGGHPPTLIDAELETLYSGFQKRRESIQSDSQTRDLGAGPLGGSPEWRQAEERGKKLRREEDKLRRLNSNGRVDYAIQEGVFDINLLAAIASHLSYWSDEDVSHFIVSQLLSRHRIARSNQTSDIKVT